MDEVHTISRRALLRAAAPAALAVALPAVTVAAEQEPTNLMELARRFAENARRIDPTIIGTFVGTDMRTDVPFEDRVHGVFLSRSTVEPKRRRMTKPTPTRIERLARRHAKVREEFNNCCDAADSVSPSYGGKAAEAVWRRLDRRETRALNDLLRAPVMNISDARAKSTYLRTFLHRSGAWLDEADLLTLLASYAGVM